MRITQDTSGGVLEIIEHGIIRIHQTQRARLIISLVFLSLLCGTVIPVSAMLNPAAVYCGALGYEYSVVPSEKGDFGYCLLPNNQKIDAWLFLQGKSGSDYSYCVQNKLGIRTVHDPGRCLRFLTADCAVCSFPNGTEIEVTELMGLSFKETHCGDGSCGFPENYLTCPGDCPSGSPDGYCDAVSDKICDIDCDAGKDPDCVPPDEMDTLPQKSQQFTTRSSLPAGLSLLALVTLGIIGFRKRN